MGIPPSPGTTSLHPPGYPHELLTFQWLLRASPGHTQLSLVPYTSLEAVYMASTEAGRCLSAKDSGTGDRLTEHHRPCGEPMLFSCRMFVCGQVLQQSRAREAIWPSAPQPLSPCLRILVLLTELQAFSLLHFSLGSPSLCRMQSGTHRGNRILQSDCQLLSHCPEPASPCVLVSCCCGKTL